MRKINTFQETAQTGRVVLDLGDGTTLDTDRLATKDTGWRFITIATGTARLRRVGALVELGVSNYRPPSTGDNVLVQMPAGFRPSATTIATVQENAALRIGQALSYSPFEVKALAIGTANSYVTASFTFTTTDAWPTTLPGTAV